MLSEALLVLTLVGQAPSNPIVNAVEFHLGEDAQPTDHFNLDEAGLELVEPIELSVNDAGRAGSRDVEALLLIGDRSARVRLASAGGAVFRGDVTDSVRGLAPSVNEILRAEYESSSREVESAEARMATLCSVELVDLDGVPVTGLSIGHPRVRIRVVDLDEPLTKNRLFARVRVIQRLDLNGDGRISGPAEENWISDSEPLRLVPVEDPTGRYFLSQPVHVNNKGVGLFEKGSILAQAAIYLSILEDPNIRWNLKCSFVGSMIEMLNAIAISENGGDREGLDLPSHICSDEEVLAFIAPENLARLKRVFEDRAAAGLTLADLPIRNNRINIALPVFRVVVEYEDLDGPERDRCTYEF